MAFSMSSYGESDASFRWHSNNGPPSSAIRKFVYSFVDASNAYHRSQRVKIKTAIVNSRAA